MKHMHWFSKYAKWFCFAAMLFFVHPAFADIRGFDVVAQTSEGDVLLYKDSYALVIGNSAYRNGWDALPGVSKDTQEVAETLKKQGFKVTLATDLTKKEFDQVLGEFSEKYGSELNNRLLLYYAGHGYTRTMANNEELGYLVMVDAPLPDRDLVGFRLASVDMQSLVTEAKLIKSRHVLFMFDSCFSGTILNLRSTLAPKSLSLNVQYPVRQFITAGRANEPVPDRSVFKQAFIDILEGRVPEPIPDGYLTGEELGLYLKTTVPQYNPNQHPQYGKIQDISLDKGDFVFVLSPPTEAAKETAQRSLSTVGHLEVRGPEGAQLSINGKEAGQLPSFLPDLPIGKCVVKVTKPGFEEWEQQVTIEPGQKITVTVNLNPEDVQPGEIDIKAPEGALVFMGNEKVGQGPTRLRNLKPDSYVVRVKKPGFEDFEQEIQVAPGQKQFVAVTLRRLLPNAARMEIRAPEGALVFLGEKKVGKGTVTLSDLEPSSYMIRVSKPGFENFEQEVKLEAGQNQLLIVTLKQSLPNTGQMEIKTPENGLVFVDGQKAGETPILLPHLTAGMYHIKISKPGFKDWEQDVLVEPGQKRLVYPVLKSVQKNYGRLFVKVQPSDAVIRIVDLERPFQQGIELDPGRYRVEISKAGYETALEWVEIVQGEEKQMEVHLIRDMITDSSQS